MKKVITSTQAPTPIGPYSQAILSGDTLYISGQVPMNIKTGELEMSSIEAETKCVMTNLEAILKEAGMTFENVVKCSIFISDMNNFGRINEVYGQYFDKNTAPARETVQVAALPRGVNVEISAIAVK